MTITWLGQYYARIGTLGFLGVSLLSAVAATVFFSSFAYAADAKWEGDKLNYGGNAYESTNYSDVNDEIHTHIDDEKPLANPNDRAGSIHERYSYYEWKENSDCQDAIAFPPGADPKTATQAVWYKIDSNWGGLNCARKETKVISIEPAPVNNEGAPDASSINSLEEVKSCKVQWLGFIICWVSKIIGWVVQGTFAILEKLMYVSPLTQNNSGGQRLYEIWGIFRNIANALLIIFFVAIIISQVTNVGIDNYGVKKILPRIVVGAILINVSFWVCAILVDVSNILGNSLYHVLKDIAAPVQPNITAIGSIIVLALTAGAGFLLYMNILALTPMLVSGAFAIFMTVAILIARQAIVIMLVALSPIAFALNILPSTQKWFSKWWTNFLIILMIYPMVAVVYGGTQVMAGIISISAPHSNDEITQVLFGIFSLAVQIIPFFFVPILIKVGGRLVSRFTGVVNNPSKGLFDNTKKRVGNWAEDKEKLRETNALAGKTNKDGSIKKNNGLYARSKRRSNRRDTIAKSHEGDLKDPSQGAYGSYMSHSSTAPKVAKAVAANTGNRGGNGAFANAGALSSSGRAAVTNRADALESSLANTDMEIEIDKITAGEARFENEQYSLKELKAANEQGVDRDGNQLTENEQSAAKSLLAKYGSLDDIHNLIDQVSGEQSSAKVREALVRSISQNAAAKGQVHLGGAGLQAVRNGAGVGQLYQQAVDKKLYNAANLPSQSTASLAGLSRHADGYSEEGKQHIRQQMSVAKSKTKYSDKFSSAGMRHADSI